MQAVSRDKWEPKASDRICSRHFVGGKSSTNPKDVNYVPTLFDDGKRRINTPTVDYNRLERIAKRARLRDERNQVEEAADVLVALSSTPSVIVSRTTHKDSAVQTELSSFPTLQSNEASLKVDNQVLQLQVETLEQDLFTVKTNLKRQMVSVIKGNDDSTKFYTGLPTYAVFTALLEYIQPLVEMSHQTSSETNQGRKRSLTYEEEFLAILMRLRLGLLLEDLANRFEVHPSTISRIFKTWIKILAVELKRIFPWPSKQQIMARTPLSFKTFPNTRIIIDCSEFFIQRPSSLQGQALTFSHYKHHNTFKVLIGISPGGVITFVSELWGGRISDQAITEKSGLLDLLEPGDNVMADRGFDVGNILQHRGVTLNIPPFLGQRDQLAIWEVEATRRIASLRIHVERAIGRIKNYRLLQLPFPLTLADLASDIVCVCSYLTNFCKPIIPTDDP